MTPFQRGPDGGALGARDDVATRRLRQIRQAGNGAPSATSVHLEHRIRPTLRHAGPEDGRPTTGGRHVSSDRREEGSFSKRRRHRYE